MRRNTKVTRAVRVRRALLHTLNSVDDDCAVLTSAGIDSSSLISALLLLKRRPLIVSFTLDDRKSADFLGAKKIAHAAGLDFLPIILPTNLDALKANIRQQIELGQRKKTAIECAWPMMLTLPKIPVKTIVAGTCADGHFGVSKTAMMFHRSNPRDLDAYRDSLFNNPDYANARFLQQYATAHGKILAIPYHTPSIVGLFRGATWDELNRPRQKQTIRDAFPEMEDHFPWMMKSRHTNLQLGDSGIAALFEQLLDTNWNPDHRYKSVVGIYNHIARQSQEMMEGGVRLGLVR